VTKGVQEIHLDKHIRLLDSPGIVFTSGEGAAAAALRNAIKVRSTAAQRCCKLTATDCC
jgi:nuclear GTP-binding protein